jgi:hypothetical protein
LRLAWPWRPPGLLPTPPPNLPPQAHSCFKKGCMVAGVTHLRLLPTRAEDG